MFDGGHLPKVSDGEDNVNGGRLLKVSGGDGDVGATSMLGGNCLDCEQTTGAAGVSGVTSFVVCSDSDDELLSRDRLQKNSVAYLNNRKHS